MNGRSLIASLVTDIRPVSQAPAPASDEPCFAGTVRPVVQSDMSRVWQSRIGDLARQGVIHSRSSVPMGRTLTALIQHTRVDTRDGVPALSTESLYRDLARYQHMEEMVDLPAFRRHVRRWAEAHSLLVSPMAGLPLEAEHVVGIAYRIRPLSQESVATYIEAMAAFARD